LIAVRQQQCRLAVPAYRSMSAVAATVPGMKPAVALAQLAALRVQAESSPMELYPEGPRAEWKAKVEAVLTRSLGAKHHTTEAFRQIQYGLMVLFGDTPASEWHAAFREGLSRAIGYIKAAEYEIGLLTLDDAPVDDRAFDPELWEHVKGVVADEDWPKVAGLVVIYVEDRVRTWAGKPKDKHGDDLVGKGLYAAVFADDSEYRLGKRRGEWEGWRMLAMGFAQAIGNVDRHHVQDRLDARRYALGVLGLGSLLLTQLRYEHDDLLRES
jgi:hypothetical protein